MGGFPPTWAEVDPWAWYDPGLTITMQTCLRSGMRTLLLGIALLVSADVNATWICKGTIYCTKPDKPDHTCHHPTWEPVHARNETEAACKLMLDCYNSAPEQHYQCDWSQVECKKP